MLASIDPQDGRTSYMVPVGRGVQQEYQNMQESFTCCVGTGMENHALHASGIWFESADTAWLNLYIPSTATLDNGMKATLETTFPDGETATLAIATRVPKQFTLAIRRPGWAGDGFAIRVNGESLPLPLQASLRAGPAGGRDTGAEERGVPASTYVEVSRTWKDGDTVELILPKALRLEPTPDDRSVTAMMWGPLVLAADHGPRRDGRQAAGAIAIPVLVPPDGSVITEWVKPGAKPGDFIATAVARVSGSGERPGNQLLTPFHRTHRRTYSTYMDVLSPAEFDARGRALAAKRERLRRLEAATIAFVQPGEMQPERDFNYQSEPATRQPVRTNGRGSRGGTGWFSFDLPADPSAPVSLIVTYFNEPGLPAQNADFQILIDGHPVAKFAPDRSATGFHDIRYAVPAELTRDRAHFTVKFEAGERGRVLPVFGVRVVRTSAL